MNGKFKIMTWCPTVILVVLTVFFLILTSHINGQLTFVTGHIIADQLLTSASQRSSENDSSLPDGTQDKMSPDGNPEQHKCSYLVLAPILKTDNPEHRLKKQTISSVGFDTPPVGRHHQNNVLTTTSLISSDLGRRLTLVGNKPSGTS